MQIIKRFVMMFTLAAFVCATTGCATNGHGVATTNHVNHSQSSPAKTDDAEDSEGYSTGVKALAIGAGAVLLVVALGFAAANLGAKGIGNNIGGSIA